MPIIPLGVGAYKRLRSGLPEVQLRNMLLEPEMDGLSPDKLVRITRAGLAPYRTFAGSKVRGLFAQAGVYGGDLFASAGNTLYRETGALGSIGGAQPVQMAATNFGLYACNGESAFAYTGALSAIQMPDNRTVIDLDTIAGYVLLACEDGRFYWLRPGEDEIDPLDFATAESAPDGLVAARRVGDEVWLFGRSTVEPWQLTGDADAPFQKAAGRQYDRGCLSGYTVCRFDNAVQWVGDDGVVYRGGAVPQRVSDHGIEERISRAKGALTAWVAEDTGHKLYVLDVLGEGTFALDAASGQWSEFASGAGKGWRAWRGVSIGTNVFAGDRESGRVWTLSATSDDDGSPIINRVTGFAPLATRAPRLDSFSVGVGLAQDGAIDLRWKDGRETYPAYPETLEARAPFDVVNVYRLGMPTQPGREFEITIAGRASIYGAMVNEAWQ